jgi:integrase
MATITQLPSGTWRWQISTGRKVLTKEGGFRYQRLTGTAVSEAVAKADAARELAKIRRETPKGARGEADLTLGQWMDYWLDWHKGDLQAYTIAGYRSKIDRYIKPIIGEIRLSRLDVVHVEELLDVMRDKGLSKSTRHQTREILSGALRHAERRKLVQKNWARLADAPKGEKGREMSPPDPKRAKMALEAAAKLGPTHELLVVLALHTGARRGELCALRWTDLTGDSITIARSLTVTQSEWIEKPTKTGSERTIPLPPSVLQLLKAQRQRHAALYESAGVPNVSAFILSDDGSAPWTPWQAYQRWTVIRDACGMADVRLHDLRHFVATQLIAAGVSAKDVAERLGHANAAVTMKVYAHSTDAGQRAATSKLDELLA